MRRYALLQGVPVASKGSLVGLAEGAVPGYRFRTVTGGASLGHGVQSLEVVPYR